MNFLKIKRCLSCAPALVLTSIVTITQCKGETTGQRQTFELPTNQTRSAGPLIKSPSDNGQFDGLYLDRSGHLVMQLLLNSSGRAAVQFLSQAGSSYDMSTREQTELANDARSLSDFLTARGLLRQSPKTSVQSKDVFLETKVFDYPTCQWPYNEDVLVGSEKSNSKRLVLFKQLAVPNTKDYDLACEAGPGTLPLTTRYEVLNPLLFQIPGYGTVIAFSSPAMVFIVKKPNTFLQDLEQSGIIVVASEDVIEGYYKVTVNLLAPNRALSETETKIRLEKPLPLTNKGSANALSSVR